MGVIFTRVDGVMNMLFNSISTGRREDGATDSNSVFNTPSASWESRCICQAHKSIHIKIRTNKNPFDNLNYAFQNTIISAYQIEKVALVVFRSLAG